MVAVLKETSKAEFLFSKNTGITVATAKSGFHRESFTAYLITNHSQQQFFRTRCNPTFTIFCKISPYRRNMNVLEQHSRYLLVQSQQNVFLHRRIICKMCLKLTIKTPDRCH